MLVILFGLAGSGKNYVGQIFKKYSNFHFWDADVLLTEEMKECISKKQSFTQNMRDNYTDIIIKHIKTLTAKHENVVISQGLYKNQNREQIFSQYPNALFLRIVTEPQVWLNRLKKRNNAIDENYAIQMSLNFEPPIHHYYDINNNTENSDSVIIDQLTTIPILTKNFPKSYQTS